MSDSTGRDYLRIAAVYLSIEVLSSACADTYPPLHRIVDGTLTGAFLDLAPKYAAYYVGIKT